MDVDLMNDNICEQIKELSQQIKEAMKEPINQS